MVDRGVHLHGFLTLPWGGGRSLLLCPGCWASTAVGEEPQLSSCCAELGYSSFTPKRDWIIDHMLILLVGWLVNLKQVVTVVAQAVLRLNPSVSHRQGLQITRHV